MKTVNKITRTVQGSGLALAAILIAMFISVVPANAQYNPTGDDGITASPKMRAQLNDRKAKATPVVATETSMVCAKCNDTWVAQTDSNSKGLGARTLMGQTTKLVSQHLCAGCSTDLAAAGTGKAKHTVATHKCSSCGAENLACCSAKGAGAAVATKGMEKSVEIAPLK